MGKSKELSIDLKEHIIDLNKSGESLGFISKQLQVPRSTVQTKLYTASPRPTRLISLNYICHLVHYILRIQGSWWFQGFKEVRTSQMTSGNLAPLTPLNLNLKFSIANCINLVKWTIWYQLSDPTNPSQSTSLRNQLFLKLSYRLPTAHTEADMWRWGRQMCPRQPVEQGRKWDPNHIHHLLRCLFVCCLTEASTTQTLETTMTNIQRFTLPPAKYWSNVCYTPHIMLRWETNCSLHCLTML